MNDDLSPASVRAAILADFLGLREDLKREAEALCEKLRKSGLPKGCSVDSRVKSLESLTAKIVAREFQAPTKRIGALGDLRDVVGIRLIAPTVGEIPQLCALVERCFGNDQGLRADETRPWRQGLEEAQFDYDSIHFVIEHRFGTRTLPVEIQVHTALSNTWSNVSHDTLYKSDYRPTEIKARFGATDSPQGAKHEMGRLKAALEMVDEHYERFMTRLDRLDDYLGPFLTRTEAEREVVPLDAILDQRISAEDRASARRRRARLLRRTGSLDEAAAAYAECDEDWKSTPGGRLEGASLELARLYAEKPTGVGMPSARVADVVASARASAKGWLGGGGPTGEGDWARWSRQASREERRGYIQARALEAEAMLAGWDPQEKSPKKEEALLQAARQASASAPDDPMVLAQLMVASLVAGAEPHRLATDIRASLDAGIARCRELVAQGLEIPRAAFAHGRLALLREPIDAVNDEAFRAYCHGVAHCLHPAAAVHARSELGRERTALERIEEAGPHRGYGKRVQECRVLFDLALSVLDQRSSTRKPTERLAAVVVGTTNEQAPGWEQGPRWTETLRTALGGFGGTIIGGGTDQGVCQCVLDALAGTGQTPLGYTANRTLRGWAVSGGDRSKLPPTDIGAALFYWQDLLASEEPVRPENVTLLGFGGGRVSACEYRLAAALGARVAIFEPAGRGGAAFLADPTWRFIRNVFPLLPDGDAAWYAIRRGEGWPAQLEIRIASALHNAYVSEREALKVTHDIPAEWTKLGSRLQGSNFAQARALRPMLTRFGFEVVAGKAEAPELPIEDLARLEHARWAVDKALDGYRYGATRDNAKLTHPDLRPWETVDWLPAPPERGDEFKGLSEVAKDKDRFFVRAWPTILEAVGLTIRRI